MFRVLEDLNSNRDGSKYIEVRNKLKATIHDFFVTFRVSHSHRVYGDNPSYGILDGDGGTVDMA
jgi:hypothetical protein